MKWIVNIVLFVIGAACIALPLILGWNASAIAGAFGIGGAALYGAIRMLARTVRPDISADATGVAVLMGSMRWYDWLVMVGLVVLGIVLGIVLGG